MKLMTYHNPLLSFDSLFGDPFEAFAPLFEVARKPRTESTIEWFEDDENYYARVDLPGVAKEELNLEFDADLIHLSVEREKNGETVRREKKVRVPEGILSDQAEAKLTDGVLTLTLPKAPEKKPVTIEIA